MGARIRGRAVQVATTLPAQTSTFTSSKPQMCCDKAKKNRNVTNTHTEMVFSVHGLFGNEF